MVFKYNRKLLKPFNISDDGIVMMKKSLSNICYFEMENKFVGMRKVEWKLFTPEVDTYSRGENHLCSGSRRHNPSN